MGRAGIVAAILVAHAVTGVRAECESGVIVACVLGTFFGCCVAAAAAAIYLFLRRRSRRRRRLGSSDRMGKPFRAHANGAFATESSDSIAFTFGQLAAPSETDVGKWSHSKPCLGKHHLQDNGGRAVALDDACRPLQKCVTIDLLSKDSTGLGISICSSYTNGVFVKELQDRSPAKECRLIDVGDRIVGITISFENIVFDDAAAILGCASPYHVQLHLLKQSQGVQMPARKLLSGSSQDCGIQLNLSSNCKTGGLLGHPAFARSQSLSNGAALNGRLFRESLLCHQTSTTSNGSLDLDEVTSLPLDETDSISDVKDAVARTGTASSYASIIALSGTVREDNLISLRQGPTQQESAAVQAGATAQGWSQHELQISSPESKRQSWQGSEASTKPSELLGTTAAGDVVVTTALPEQPVATGDSNATAIALPIITDCEGVQLILKDGSECVHLNMKDGTVSPKASTKSYAHSITLDLKCVTTDESETDGGSLTAGEPPLTSLVGKGCDGKSKNEAVLSTTVEVEKPVLRPRHLPSAVLDLVHKKDAAAMVVDQLEAFATLTRSNNNQGPRHDQKIQVNNERATAGMIQTPEGESSILTAVLNAAKAAGDTSSADEEEDVESLRHSSASCEQQTATGGRSWTAAAEIKVLAAKLGSKEGSSSSQSVGNAHSVPAVAQPADPRSAEEERARYFSGMLRAAKS